MSKVLRTAAIIVGTVALVAATAGAAAPFLAGVAGSSLVGSAAIAAGIASVAGTIGTIASIAAVVLSIGASLTSTPPPLGGSSTKFKADPQSTLPYTMGRTLVGGNIVHRVTHNTAGYNLPDLQTFVVILSIAGPINAIEAFQADKVTTAFSAGNAVGYYNSWMFQTQQLGQSPEAAALRVTPGGTLPPNWSTSSKLSGMAAAMWTVRYDQKGKYYANGVPAPGWVLQGVKVYDPRLDSTYPGGSGSCRALNESTYVYSENPYLHALTFALGRYQNGTRICGIGMPIAGINVPAFVEGANISDANGWKIGGQITSGDDKWGALKAILQAGAGEPMHLGAQLSCMISTPRTVLDTININDVVGEVVVNATQPRRDRINSIVPRYRSEAHLWEIISASPVTVATHVTADGGLRSKEVSYSLVQQLTQAQQLARYDIENAREFGPISLPCKLRWMGYKPGDCVALVQPEVGLNGQPMVIRNRSIDPSSGIVTLSGNSETNAKHAFALGQTGTAPPTPSVTAPPVAPQPGASDWVIAGTSLTSGSSSTPALVITGAATNTPIDGVIVEYRLWVSGQAADVNWIQGGSGGPDLTRVEITAILPGTQYEVAVSYRLGVFAGTRRILGPVTTASIGVPWAGVGGTGKPGDNATQNLAGDFANRNGSFEMEPNGDGTLPGWLKSGYGGSLTRLRNAGSVPFRGSWMGVLTGKEALNSEPFVTSAGEILWLRSAIGFNAGPAGSQASGDRATVFIGIRYYNQFDTQIYEQAMYAGSTRSPAAPYFDELVFASPTGAVSARLWVYQDLGASGQTGTSTLIDFFECSRSQFGATRNVSRGAWAGGVAYVSGDVVTYGGTSSVAVADHVSVTGSPPPNANFALLASAGADALQVAVSPGAIAVACDVVGGIKAGQLPKTIQFYAFRNGANLTSTATFAYTPANCAITDNGAGNISVDNITAQDASVDVVVTAAGQTGRAKTTMTKVRDGFSAASTVASGSNISSTSAVQLAARTLGVGPSGNCVLSLSAIYSTNGTTGAKSFRWYAQGFYRTTPGSGSWVSMGSEQSGSLCTQAADIAPGEPGNVVDGSLSASWTIAGPTSPNNWEFMVMGRTGDSRDSGSWSFAVSYAP